MNVLLVDNGTSYLPQLYGLIPAAVVKATPFEKLVNHNFDSYDLIILSGGHKYAIMSHRHKYARELNLITRTDKPVIGICMGLELIVIAFEGTLKFLRRDVHREVTIHVDPHNPLANGREAFKVFENHHRGIKSLPKVLVPLGRSAQGIEIIKHESRPIYGFQFHPEMSSSGDGKLLIGQAIQQICQNRAE
jgi:GMP synthase (glutamine-hydrolysing)